MKQLQKMAALIILVVSVSGVLAQPRFEVPLIVTDGVDTLILYFGIFPEAHFCIDPADSINGHFESFLPPAPPRGIFDARFVSPRAGSNLTCFDQGSRNDYRPFTSAAQRDTFRVRAQVGMGTTLTFCWPESLSRYFTELTNCGISTLVETCVTYPLDFVVCNFISGGLVVTGLHEKNPEGITDEFVLFQNYPNPFNPTISIEFRIPKFDFVALRVYNILGQEVRTLVNEKKDGGSHHASFDGTGLPSGVYVYRIQSGGHVANRKMILLR